MAAKITNLNSLTDDASMSDEREILLTPGEYRDFIKEQHPLTKDKQLFITPPVSESFHEISRAIYYRQKGISFIAKPTVGKSSAIEGLIKMLRKAYPLIPVFNACAVDHDVMSEKAVFADLLQGIGHVLGSSQNERVSAKAKADALFTVIHLSCLETKSDQAIFFIDEAQSWKAREWLYLKGLVNRLAGSKYGIRLLVITFGQPELRGVINAIKSGKVEGQGHDIYTRFFRNVHDFRGINSLDDLKEIFGALDDFTMDDFPDGSGIPYSEFFYPRAFAAGWRMKSEAERLWPLLRKSYSFANDLPMTPFFEIVKAFLDGADDDMTMRKRGSELWDAAIDASCLHTYRDDDGA